LTKSLHGPDEMASRAGFGLRAVVWRPLTYPIMISPQWRSVDDLTTHAISGFMFR